MGRANMKMMVQEMRAPTNPPVLEETPIISQHNEGDRNRPSITGSKTPFAWHSRRKKKKKNKQREKTPLTYRERSS